MTTEQLTKYEPSFSFIVPAYNPGIYVLDHIISLISVLKSTGYQFEVILVDDGSTDNSITRLSQIKDEPLKVISHSSNQGKGAAIRTGFKHASFSWVGFIDADGDIPASCVLGLIDVAINKNPDIILGSKTQQGSHIQSSFYRKVLSKGFQLTIKVLFKFPLKDTQTGLKLFKKEVINAIEKHLKENGFAIDLEILLLATKLGFTSVVEVPVNIVKRKTSTVSISQVISIAKDTIRIYRRIKNLNPDNPF